MIFGRALAGGVLAFSVAGCSIGEVHTNFSASAAVPVSVGCGAVVEVFENPTKKLVMVRSNGPADVSGLVCFKSREALVRKAVQDFFVETKRPRCVTGESAELTPWHHQFAYSCPAS